MNSYVKLIFIVTLLIACKEHSFAQQNPDSTTRADRQFFNFLTGTWKIASSTFESKTTTGGDDIYTFNQLLDGAFTSKWHFNRGTKENPNFTEAYCYIAYNNLTKNWSFYYISPLSAQYYDGKKTGDNWYFLRSFDFGNGNKFIQRQFWVLKDKNTLERHTENSTDEGRTWKHFSISVLSRT